MKLYRGFPSPSERMGFLWAMSSVKDLIIVEFGPEGTTRYLLESLKFFGAEARAKIYTTMMHEDVVVLGDNSRLLKTLLELDEKYSPEFIVVMDSSVAAVIGVDLEGLCCEYQAKIHARLIPFCGGGLSGDWTAGIKKALSFLAGFAENQTPVMEMERRYNILGCCVDEFNHMNEAKAIIGLMNHVFRASCHCLLSSGSEISQLKRLGQASINLVMRREALPAAQLLEESMGTPFLYGRPVGLQGTMDWVRKVESTCDWAVNYEDLRSTIKLLEALVYKFSDRCRVDHQKVILYGHPDIALPLQKFMNEEIGLMVQCFSNVHDGGEQSMPVLSNGEIPKKIRDDAAMVITDGLNLRGIPAEKRLQIGYPILGDVNQPALMGFQGAIYLVRRLMNVFQLQ